MSQDDRERLLMDAIPKAILLWRLSIIEEVLLSGFQLELYVKEEKSFVYWELSEVILEHLSILDSLERVIPKSRLTCKATMSLLRSFQSLNRHRSIWRTHLCTLISHLLSVALHRNVHGKARAPHSKIGKFMDYLLHSLCFQRCIIQQSAWPSTSYGGTNGRFGQSTRSCVLRSRSRISRRSLARRWRF
jgi:hypothetical protein